jgi:hypothetical protein
LRELLEQRMAQQDRAAEARWTAHEHEHAMLREAVMKAEIAVNTRLEGMNELRTQINRERGAYLTTETYEAKHEALIQKVEGQGAALNARLSTLENQAANVSGRFWALGVGLTLVVIAINVALHFLK